MRLTNDIKNTIINNALEKSGYNKEIDEYYAELSNLAVEIHEESFGGHKEMHRKLKIIEKANEAFKSIDSRAAYIRVHYNHSVSCEVGGQIRYLDLPFKEAVVTCTLKIPGDHPIAYKLHALDNLFEDLTKKRGDVINIVNPILNSVTTAKKLVTIWPEAEELLPKECQLPAKTNLPAIQIESANTLIGLPSN